MSHSKSDEVRRASHCQYTPHATLAHKGPDTNTHSPKTTPSSAAATAVLSPRSDPPNK
jgi:hypothetical protein